MSDVDLLTVMTTKNDRLAHAISFCVREYLRQGAFVYILSDDEPTEFIFDDISWFTTAEALAKVKGGWVPPPGSVAVISTRERRPGNYLQSQIVQKGQRLVVLRTIQFKSPIETEERYDLHE